MNKSKSKDRTTVIESGVVAGNTYDKYGSANPVARYLMRGFLERLNTLIESVQPNSIHEVGCGEGHLSRILCRHQVPIRASDFSAGIIDIARSQEHIEGCNITWKVAGISQLTPAEDAAHLVVCCEVLEHLPDPNDALEILQLLASPYLLVSVPREPLWRCLNLLRGKYIMQGGNTPGHINHWGKRSFIALIDRYFEILSVHSPLPWTMVLCRGRRS
jgi:2-polyprenyl-3-methyl-5-hydroxy-6-metoxy-1,4-benzoquinol methylase